MAWLAGWGKRIKFAIDHDDIDAALDWFPVRVHLSAGSEEQTTTNVSYNLYSGSKTRLGQKLTIPNRTITKLSFKFAKNGSPTGDVTFTIRQTDDTILASKVWGDAGSVATGSAVWYEATLDTPTNVDEEVRISCEYSGGDSSNFLYVARSSTDVKASEELSYYDGSWTDDATNDCGYKYAYKAVACVFDEVGANSKKIAIVPVSADQIDANQLYGEIENWDHIAEEADIWTSKDGWTIPNDADEEVYLYYDNIHADNDAYIGIKNSTPAQSVWASHFKGSYRMADGVDNEHIYDSTENNNDGTKSAAGQPTEIDGKIGKGQDCDGDHILIGTSGYADADEGTISFWAKADSTDDAFWGVGDTAGGNNRVLIQTLGDNKVRAWTTLDSGSSGYVDTDDAVDFSTLRRVTVTFASGDADIFIDKEEVATTATNEANIRFLGGISGAKLTSIAARRYGGAYGRNWDGILDEFRISVAILTPAWIKASYENERDHLITWGSEEIAEAEAQYIYPSSIASAEAFGTSKLNLKVTLGAISSLETFGTPKLNLKLLISSIASLESFGTAKINQRIKAVAIASVEAFGNAKINQRIKVVAIASAEAFGTATIMVVGRVLKVKVITTLYRKIRIGTR